jgi:hypothetical protein
MRPSTLLYGASLLASALAEFKYSGKMTQNGVEVPVEFTELPSHNRTRSHARHSKRDGPVSTTNNWAGTIQGKDSSRFEQSCVVFLTFLQRHRSRECSNRSLASGRFLQSLLLALLLHHPHITYISGTACHPIVELFFKQERPIL